MQVGKYQLIRELGVGGMAEVFLARTAGPMGFEKLLVLKRILPHMAREPAFVQMFLSEATLAARLNHPNIVQIFDFGESDGTYYLAMEYIDGPSLRTLLDDSLRHGEPLPPVPCARIIAAACEGLSFAHNFRDLATHQPLNIVHRDISPDNILLSRQGAVKVADFGIAKAAGQQHRTQTGMIKGKLAYMPPEQIRNLELDQRVDVYALGVVFYELVTGNRPFDATTDANLMQSILFELPMPAVLRQPDLPEAVQKIIRRALAKDRDERYQDCNAFQADLEEFILSTGKPVTTQHVAQLIAQISPPVHNAPLPPLPPGSPPLTETAIRPSQEPAPLPADHPTLADTELHAAPSPDPLPKGQAAAVPTPRKGKLGAAIAAGVVLLASGGGYLLWGKAGPAQPEFTVPSVPSPPTPPTAPAEVPVPQVPEEPRANQDAKTGTLEFEVKPRADVYLEGQWLAKTSRGVLDINPGTYRVKFVNKKLRKMVERPVEVKGGQTTFITVDLLHEEAPKP
ncbi:MAG TPA: serine/threonine-protein kinase [Hyalangium sp.]|nr:serine/threonine-protein kinase [Hyalangium sp.]